MSKAKDNKPAEGTAIAPFSTNPKHIEAAIKNLDFKPLAEDFAIEFKIDKTTAAEFVKRSDEVIKAHQKLGMGYLELCKLIREKQITPAQVTGMMSALGFAKTRISEVNRVSQCSPELWKAIDARSLGFKNALEIARGSVAVDAMEIPPSEQREAGVAGNEADQDGANVTTEGTHATDRATDYKMVFQILAKRLQAAAAKCNEGRGKVKSILNKEGFLWNNGQGYVVTLRRETPEEKVAREQPKPDLKTT